MNNRPSSIFTTPYLVDQQLQKADVGGVGTAIETEYDAYYAFLLTECRAVSKIIEEQTHCTFVPYIGAQDFYFGQLVRNGNWNLTVDGYVLKLEDALLDVNAITIISTVMTAAQYRLCGVDNSPNAYPYWNIIFDAQAVPAWDTTFTKKIIVSAEWGVQDNIRTSYTTIGTLAAAVADTTTTSVRVADASLYHVYEYIRIDDELMLITATDTTTTPDTLTVERGVNGFTAATHLIASDVKRWNVVYDVQKLATKMVAYGYQRRADTGERIQVVDGTAYIAKFSEEISAIAERRTFTRLEPG